MTRYLVFYRHGPHRLVVQYGDDKRYRLVHVDTDHQAFDPGAFSHWDVFKQANTVYNRSASIPIGRTTPTSQLVLDAFAICKSPAIEVKLARLIQLHDDGWVVHSYCRSHRIQFPSI